MCGCKDYGCDDELYVWVLRSYMYGYECMCGSGRILCLGV